MKPLSVLLAAVCILLLTSLGGCALLNLPGDSSYFSQTDPLLGGVLPVGHFADLPGPVYPHKRLRGGKGLPSGGALYAPGSSWTAIWRKTAASTPFRTALTTCPAFGGHRGLHGKGFFSKTPCCWWCWRSPAAPSATRWPRWCPRRRNPDQHPPEPSRRLHPGHGTVAYRH